MTRPAPATRADFRSFLALQTRWKDNDALGHLNNAEYLSLADTAISHWQIANDIPITGPGAFRFVVVETGCRYHAEAAFPDTLHAGLHLGHLGRSSFRHDIGLFRNDADTACAELFFIMVLTDAAGRPIPLPPQVRDRLETLRSPTA